MQVSDITRKRKVVLTYKIAYLIIFLGFLYGLISAFYFNLTISFFPFFAALISIFSVILLRKNILFLPRILLSLSPILLDSLFHAALVQDHETIITSLYLTEFGMILIPWVLFDYDEKRSLVFCVIVGFLFLVFQNELNSIFPFLSESDTPFRNTFLDYSTYLTAMIVIFLCLYFFLGEQNKYEKENFDLLKELREKNEEISTQNEELNEAHQQISEINVELENKVRKRTKTLERHNKLLAEYAFINAHLIRAPICRIMGLNYLLKKTESETEKSQIYKYLDRTIHEMQYLTRRVSVLLARGGYYDRYDLDYDNKKEAIQESTHQMDKSRKKRRKKSKSG